MTRERKRKSKKSLMTDRALRRLRSITKGVPSAEETKAACLQTKEGTLESYGAGSVCPW